MTKLQIHTLIRSIIELLPSLEDKVGTECLNLIALFADICGRVSKKAKNPSYFMEKKSNGSYWIIVGCIYIQSVS